MPTNTPRFVPIAFPDNQSIRYFVADINCLDAICECRMPQDANAIAEALNKDEAFPPRLKVEHATIEHWKRLPSPDPGSVTLLTR